MLLKVWASWVVGWIYCFNKLNITAHKEIWWDCRVSRCWNWVLLSCWMWQCAVSPVQTCRVARIVLWQCAVSPVQTCRVARIVLWQCAVSPVQACRDASIVLWMCAFSPVQACIVASIVLWQCAVSSVQACRDASIVLWMCAFSPVQACIVASIVLWVCSQSGASVPCCEHRALKMCSHSGASVHCCEHRTVSVQSIWCKRALLRASCCECAVILVQACIVASIVLPAPTTAIPENNKLTIILFARKRRNRTAVLLSKFCSFLKERNPENLTQLISSFDSYRQSFIDSLFNITSVESDFYMTISLNSISKFCRKHVPRTYFNISIHVPCIFIIRYYNQQTSC